MNNKKFTKLYYFSFEGETEKWYLEWLERELNVSEMLNYKVSFKLIGKNPVKAVKRLGLLYKTNIYHICDYEDEQSDRILKSAIDSIRMAEKINNIKYYLAYSNLAFELWLILHKRAFNKRLVNNSAYLQYINLCYDEKFRSLNEYKEEKNFKKILSKLSLNNVRTAIENAKRIMQNNKNNCFELCDYRKEKYYKENPSISVHKIIEQILNKDIKNKFI